SITVNTLSYFFFFFSSRRRHTRSKRDWSSDVSSSDLVRSRSSGKIRWRAAPKQPNGLPEPVRETLWHDSRSNDWIPSGLWSKAQIGRASCRERGEGCEGAGVV